MYHQVAPTTISPSILSTMTCPTDPLVFRRSTNGFEYRDTGTCRRVASYSSCIIGTRMIQMARLLPTSHRLFLALKNETKSGKKIRMRRITEASREVYVDQMFYLSHYTINGSIPHFSYLSDLERIHLEYREKNQKRLGVSYYRQ
jgi:hypothetical protein